MKLFNQQAERQLLEKVKTLREQHYGWRCLYINFSENKEEFSEGLRTNVVTNILTKLLEDDDGHIYLCGDGDVLILFQGQVAPILAKIGEQFIELGGHGMEGDLYNVFDLSRQWQIFFAFCEKKVATASNSSDQKQVFALPIRTSLPEIDAKLFPTMRAAPRKKLRVLLVEDDPFTRRLVAKALKGEFDIVEASDATEALTLYGETAPDAVFLDIELPDFNGHTVLGRMLAFDPSAFVVMLSGNSIKENILAALEKGAKGFVTKPFAKEKLLHYLRLCESTRKFVPLKEGASS